MQAIPRDRVLLETDGPYAKDRGQPARPDRMEDLAKVLGAFWGTDFADTTRILTANQTRFRAAVP